MTERVISVRAEVVLDVSDDKELRELRDALTAQVRRLVETSVYVDRVIHVGTVTRQATR